MVKQKTLNIPNIRAWKMLSGKVNADWLSQLLSDRSNKDNINQEPSNSKKQTRYYLGEAYPGVYFTQREADIAMIMEGRTNHEIACWLQISRRTVEFYIFKMKRKVGCQKKSALAEMIKNINFERIFKTTLPDLEC